ncbi:MAG TPA: acetyl-CoA hydrolase/transferase C-terminal domain-containing protein [Burkholderiaceae bacterium]|jgi:acetyl-CoA hydrolase
MDFVDLRALDWPALVRPGDRIACSHMTAEPVALLRSLAASGAHGGAYAVALGVPFSDAASAFPAATALTSFGGMGTAGALARQRPVSLSREHYSRCAAVYERGEQPVDVALVSLARAADGRLFLGAAHGPGLAAARRAARVVVEVNPVAPAVLGAPWPMDLRVDAAVEAAYPVAAAGASRISEVERQIAAHVAPLVADGACLQVGIGSLPSAVLEGLSGHRGLGLHSGMLTPALWRLVETGAIDNSRKTIDAGVSVAGVVYGDAALYAAVNENSRVRLREPGYTHAAEVIARLDGFFALNSALEVDLQGRMNAETVIASDGRPRAVGGVGGLVDFVRAARHSRGGRAVIALPSRSAAGAPRIVACLSGPVTIDAADADTVVTEHGVAELRGASPAQRAEALIAIAHPDDREALRRALG